MNTTGTIKVLTFFTGMNLTFYAGGSKLDFYATGSQNGSNPNILNFVIQSSISNSMEVYSMAFAFIFWNTNTVETGKIPIKVTFE